MNICPLCPEGILDPECSPSLLSHGFSSGNKLSAATCFHSVISSLPLLILSLSPSCPHLPHLFSSIYIYHHSILSHIKSNARLFCIHVLRHRKLAVLECDCSRSGADFGRLKYPPSSLTTLIKAISPSSELWESPALRHFSFSLCFNLSQVVYLSSLFLSSNSNWHVKKKNISKSSPSEATFCLEFCVFLSELNPACLTFKWPLIKVNR